MGRIAVLDQNMINMIAAGEVIERPASVVKGLFAKKLIIFSAALVVFFCSVFAGADTGQLGVKIERNVPVPMRDGITLRADIHRPDRGGPYPVLVQRTPYGKDGGRFNRFVRAGYIVVSQDVRGLHESEGTWKSFIHRETHDGEDAYDTIEWAAALPGSTGKVATFGVSYLGYVQWRLASQGPPSLVTMSANAIAAQHTYYRKNGAMRPVELAVWICNFSPEMRRRAGRPGVHTRWEATRLWQGEESIKWNNFLPRLELPEEIFEDETKVMKDYMENPHFDPLRLDEGCKDISVPNLEFAGWYDMSNGDMLLFRTMVREAKTETARQGTRIIIGPWSHSQYGRRYGNIDFGAEAALDKIAAQIRWFDYWLKGIQNGVDRDPPVRMFVMGDNQWRDEQGWPLQRSKDKILYITSDGHANTPNGDGRLVFEETTSSEIDNYVYDPSNPVPTPSADMPLDQRPLADRQDILVYQTEPLVERLEVTGNPIIELYAESSVPDTDWFVRLIDVAPDGCARSVSGGVVRACYRDGFDRKKFLNPGEVVKYTIRMRPTSNAFLPGHRIRLDITSSDFPNYDFNHGTAANQNADTTLVVANQTIYHGGQQATRIILPWVPNSTQEEKPAKEEKPESVAERQTYPLHQAAGDGDSELVRQLLSQGADINAQDNNGRTALYTAVASNRIETAQLLIAQGADINAKNRRGLTPLHRAVRAGRSNIAQLLIANGADISAEDADGRTPLYTAITSNRIEAAQLLIAQGADINTKDNRGLTALHSAAVEGRRDVAEFLLARGGGVDRRDDNYQFTALHYAARFGNKDVAEMLIAKGADINAKDKWGYQPIHWAAYHDRPEIIELLIAKGADVNAKTSLGQTPLELAIPRRNTAAIEVLRKHGAK